MLLAIIFFNVWGVLQLIALGSFARTLRVRTILAGIAVGFCFCAPFAALLEYTTASVIAALIARPVEAVMAVTTYTVDPLTEEIIRVVPLALLLLVPVVRRQLSVTDCVLIGAAAGAGFGLAEDLYRFSAAPQYATPVPGGWVAPFQSPVAAGFGRLFIPSVTTAFASWLPDMGGVGPFGLSGNTGSNVLLIWSAIVGLGVGVWLRLDGRRRWYGAAALFVYACGAHAAGNADVMARSELLLTAPFRAITFLQPLMPVAALAFAWWIDRRRHGVIIPEHVLAVEQSASPRALGTLRAALARMPESVVWLDRFVRLRRAYNTERCLGGGDADHLRPALDQMRSRIDQQLQQPASPRAAVLAWRGDTFRALRQPGTILWLVLALPSVLWFVVGGWPATAGAQRLLTEGVGWGLLLSLTVAAQVWAAWGTLRLVQASRLLVRMPISDPGVLVLLRVAGAVGTLGFAAFGLLRASGSANPATAHAIDALLSLLGGPLTALANLGPALLNAFRMSPEDLAIPLPGPGTPYFTPTGFMQGAHNNNIDEFLDRLDPFRLRRFVESAGGPRLDSGLKMQVGTGDPNDKSQLVSDIFWAGLKSFVLLPAFRGPKVGPGSGSAGSTTGGKTAAAPGVDPMGVTQPAPTVIWRTPPAGVGASRSAPIDQLAETKPAADPHAMTQPRPGVGSPKPLHVLQREAPRIDPLAVTRPASPAAGSTPPSSTAGSPSPPPVAPVNGPYQLDPKIMEWAEQPSSEAAHHMGGPELFRGANAKAEAVYHDQRNAGFTDEVAHQSSQKAWFEYVKQKQKELGILPRGLDPG